MSKVNQIEKLIVVGGGTAGWMTAAMLSKQLQKNIDIILIESEQIGTVGVGEATIPPIRRFNKMLGINEFDFLAKCNGTMKLGIQFENWLKEGHKYFHQFGRFAIDFDYIPFPYYWLQYKEKNQHANIEDFAPAWRIAKQNKFYQQPNDPRSLFNGFDYAYHFDAALYAKYLRSYAENAGVKRIEGKVVNVEKSTRTGFITEVTLDSNETISGDFFIDCTGMAALLIEKTLNVGYEDWQKYLLNDTAIAVQTTPTANLRPYTRSIAHSAGWRWQIPLQTRTGNGTVFSSNFMNADDAREQLIADVEGILTSEPNKISFRTGKRNQFWEKNCVAIGLSAGFLEPLESTSIHLIESAIMRFINFFPNKECNPINTAEFNRITHDEYDHIRDFIILHYKATKREDSEYWRYCKDMTIPDSLEEQIELFKIHGHLRVDDKQLFKHDSWLAVLLGQGIVPSESAPILAFKNDIDLELTLSKMKSNMIETVEKMPSHEQFLQKHCPYKLISR